MTKPVFILKLEAQHRDNDPRGILRLRALLKMLLRTFGFKCLEAKPEPQEP